MKIDVDGLRFAFDDGWSATKWDETDAYRRGIARLQGTAAVDLVCAQKRLVILMEAKDFRHVEADWSRVKSGALAEEVASKVRDTLAGILAAARRDPEKWKPWQVALTDRASVRVVLWLERDRSVMDDPKKKDELQHFRDRLKSRLSWLTSDVFICSQAEANRIPGLSVTDA